MIETSSETSPTDTAEKQNEAEFISNGSYRSEEAHAESVNETEEQKEKPSRVSLENTVELDYIPQQLAQPNTSQSVQSTLDATEGAKASDDYESSRAETYLSKEDFTELCSVAITEAKEVSVVSSPVSTVSISAPPLLTSAVTPVISAPPMPATSFSTPPSSISNGLATPGYSPPSSSIFSNVLSRATHPSVQRKELAKEGVIRLFCGGLSFEADETILSCYFQRYGPVVDVRIAREVGTGRHRGFGFVAIRTPKFNPAATEEQNNEALEELKRHIFGDSPHEICQRKITVQEENRAGDNKPPPMRTETLKEEPEQEPRVFVANLDGSWDNAVLKEYFSAFGEVVEVHIVTDQNGVSRNFAFVTFASLDTARKVCDGPLDYDPSTNKRRRSAKHTIRGREVTVREADPKRGRARPNHPPASFNPYPSSASSSAPPTWGFGLSPYSGVPVPGGQQDQMQQLMASYTPQGYFPGMMMLPQMFYQPNQQPSQTATYQQPSQTATYQQPSQTATYQQPSQTATYQQPSQTATYQQTSQSSSTPTQQQHQWSYYPQTPAHVPPK